MPLLSVQLHVHFAKNTSKRYQGPIEVRMTYGDVYFDVSFEYDAESALNTTSTSLHLGLHHTLKSTLMCMYVSL